MFYISDYEKEATYLRNMSLKGYHFVRNDGFSFDFIKGEPKNYFYLLDYYKVDPSEEELKQWRQEGWEDIFHAPVNYEGSWHFFRRELSEGDMLEYNENNDSRLELFERLTRNWQDPVGGRTVYGIQHRRHQHADRTARFPVDDRCLHRPCGDLSARFPHLPEYVLSDPSADRGYPQCPQAEICAGGSICTEACKIIKKMRSGNLQTNRKMLE
ncbi:MAG: DUF2812 domain-containing protein [Merdibacter sp.]